jgi:hypothetical protein
MTDNELLKSEVALIRRIVGGETELYYQLIRPYQRMIYAAHSQFCVMNRR